jgi:transposase-like protein
MEAPVMKKKPVMVMVSLCPKCRSDLIHPVVDIKTKEETFFCPGCGKEWKEEELL